MADNPVLILNFDADVCGDCGMRVARLPENLPDAGQDFQWHERDYDALRRFMLEEIAARAPDRARWTAADMEVVLVECLASVLDQYSDALDRVLAEGMLETAQQPASVRRLLSFIGFDAVAHARANVHFRFDASQPAERQLERFWRERPAAMDDARKEGVARLFDQHRMVSLQDYGERLDDHPLVARVNARSKWTGSWDVITVAIIMADTGWRLDQSFDTVPRPSASKPDQLLLFNRRVSKLKAAIEAVHIEAGAPAPIWSEDPSFRRILQGYVDALRLAGQAVMLDDAVPVGIVIVASLNLLPNYFQSEVLRAATAALGADDFFAAGKLSFGEDVFASDVIARLMAVQGVENVCLIRFKRVGRNYPDESSSGRIMLDGLEVAVCDNNPADRSRGYVSFRVNGGRRG